MGKPLTTGKFTMHRSIVLHNKTAGHNKGYIIQLTELEQGVKRFFVLRRWGPIGKEAQTKEEAFSTRVAADVCFDEWVTKKRDRGYVEAGKPPKDAKARLAEAKGLLRKAKQLEDELPQSNHNEVDEEAKEYNATARKRRDESEW